MWLGHYLRSELHAPHTWPWQHRTSMTTHALMVKRATHLDKGGVAQVRGRIFQPASKVDGPVLHQKHEPMEQHGGRKIQTGYEAGDKWRW